MIFESGVIVEQKGTGVETIGKRGPGRPKKLQGVTLLQAWDLLLKAMRTTRACRPATFKNYNRAVRALHSVLGDFDMAQLTVPALQKYVQERQRTGCQPSTINTDFRVLRVLYGHVVELELLAYIPVRIRSLKEVNRRVTTLNETDFEKLLSVAKSPLDLVFLIAAEAGLRHNEIVFMQRRDVNLDEREITIHTKCNEFGDVLFMTKGKQERVVPIPSALATRLEQHLEEMTDKRENAWLFPNPSGQPRRNFQDAVVAAFTAAGLYKPRLRPGLHMLRRTYATALCKKLDLVTVRTLGGWSNLATMERYTGTTKERMNAAIEIIDSRKGKT